MNAAEGQGLVIKLAQKNKETQTQAIKLGSGGGLPTPHANWFAAAPTSPPVRAFAAATAPVFALVPPPTPTSPVSHHRQLGHTTCQFYMDREEQLYRQACQLKGIGAETVNEIHAEEEEDDSIGSEEGPPSKIIYRYTLDEMKSYNPYRFVKS